MIFVTGGAGFIGGNFVQEWLAERDEPLLNIDKLTYAGVPDNLTARADDERHVFVKADIGDRAKMAELLAQYRPRAILNFAAETHVDRAIANPNVFVQTNVVATYNLLEEVRIYWEELSEPGKSDFRFVQISTDEVYGALTEDEEAFYEDTPYRPNNPYSASKAAGDHFARAWHRTFGLPVITTHSSNNFGPRQYPEKLIPLVILNALAAKPIPIYGNGQQRRDWINVADNCAALRAVLEKGIVGRSYCIGGGTMITNIDLVHRICTILDTLRPHSPPSAELVTFVADRPGHDHRYATNIRRIREELGWEPLTSFDEALGATVRWYLDHPRWPEKMQFA